jgi:hypothetical protein
MNDLAKQLAAREQAALVDERDECDASWAAHEWLKTELRELLEEHDARMKELLGALKADLQGQPQKINLAMQEARDAAARILEEQIRDGAKLIRSSIDGRVAELERKFVWPRRLAWVTLAAAALVLASLVVLIWKGL